MSCRNLKSPTCILFKKRNKHIPCSFDSSQALISHLIFLINKHEALLLLHSYMQSTLFLYCDIFLTTRPWINIHNHQYPSELKKHLPTDCERGWFSRRSLAMKHGTHLEPESIFIYVDWSHSCLDTCLLLCEFLKSFPCLPSHIQKRYFLINKH